MIVSVDAGVHSDPALFQKVISGSGLHYEQLQKLADSEDYSKLSRCFMDCDGLRSEGQLGRNWIRQGCSLASCAAVNHGEVLEGVRTFADSLDGLVETMQYKSRWGIRQG